MTRIVLAVAALALLCACSGTRYVPVETVRTEYRDRDVERIVTDTVSDTRFVFVKGDTLLDIRYRDRISRVEIHDTCYVVKTDSVSVPYPVERELSRWEKAKMDFGGLSIGALAVALCVAVLWLARRFGK